MLTKITYSWACWFPSDWTELCWTELCCTELCWTELCWTELCWTELCWTLELCWKPEDIWKAELEDCCWTLLDSVKGINCLDAMISLTLLEA